MFIRHLGGYVDCVLECESETQGDINLGVLSVHMVFKASSLDDIAKGVCVE